MVGRLEMVSVTCVGDVTTSVALVPTSFLLEFGVLL